MFEWKGRGLATYPEIAKAVAAITMIGEAQKFIAAYNDYIMMGLKPGYSEQANQNIAFASAYLPPETRERVLLLFGIQGIPKIYAPKDKR